MLTNKERKHQKKLSMMLRAKEIESKKKQVLRSGNIKTAFNGVSEKNYLYREDAEMANIRLLESLKRKVDREKKEANVFNIRRS